MRFEYKLLWAISFVMSSIISSASFADDSAVEIMKKNYLVSKVPTSKSTATYTLINTGGQKRVRETESLYKLKSGSSEAMRLVEFEKPADVRGTKILMIENGEADDDIWIFLPALKKVRRIVASNKKDSFAGTDFSYGDIIGYNVNDWNHKKTGTSNVNGTECVSIESKPKNRKIQEMVGYSKRISCIDIANYVVLRAEAYDVKGKLLKVFTMSDIKSIDEKRAKWQPMKITAENVTTKHKTIIEFSEFKANVSIADSVFTSRYLEK